MSLNLHKLETNFERRPDTVTVTKTGDRKHIKGALKAYLEAAGSAKLPFLPEITAKRCGFGPDGELSRRLGRTAG